MPKKEKKQKNEEKASVELSPEMPLAELPYADEQQLVIINNIDAPGMPIDKYRTIVACGDITEETSAQIMQSLFYYGSPASMGLRTFDKDADEVPTPIGFNISTCGGSALEMFGIYDVMRHISEKVEIHTYGVGKVMSAGVLLLAAGKKGQRRIGRNCRVMIHGLMGGYHGSISSMENEIAEVKWIQKRYIENMVSETFLTKKKVKSMLNQQVDIYLSAEEAVKYGIADIVV